MNIESDFLKGLSINIGFKERALENLTCSTIYVTVILLLVSIALWIKGGDGEVAIGISSTVTQYRQRRQTIQLRIVRESNLSNKTGRQLLF